MPGLLADAAAHLGVETVAQREEDLSEHVRETINKAVKQERDLAGEDEISAVGADKETEVPVSSVAVGRAVADALKRAPQDVNLQETVKEYWQSEADRPSFDYYEQGK